MKISELRKLIMKNAKGLQKPDYILLNNADYSELKEELEDLKKFLGEKESVSAFNLGGMNILSDNEILDLRNSRLELGLGDGSKIKCKHQNQWFDRTITYPSATGEQSAMVTFCSDCGERLN